ncbi:predicted protein [Sclerotinia sclerotiorum 1980 UF-70]|uniref:Secreted protein n=1 Tax=Sclerotinia sclerotiorum (strain ATCC 18683 / 1980 / Ss-1) TaxID=665079 RepID=A7EF76_SCLS1|nr:predicted protein [Sclerotinia sclerotiorum 1980 UF-70]EDO01492.1 predicted protein [Sclerotinia sclerotiorum 1980 UF-70]
MGSRRAAYTGILGLVCLDIALLLTNHANHYICPIRKTRHRIWFQTFSLFKQGLWCKIPEMCIGRSDISIRTTTTSIMRRYQSQSVTIQRLFWSWGESGGRLSPARKV